jgi:hypothetical protein
MFALNDNSLLSIVELPTQDNSNSGGVSACFNSSPSQVRVILRDLSGKASWDSVHLYSPASKENNRKEDNSNSLLK